MKATVEPYLLHFKNEIGTSRGKMSHKKTYILNLEEEENNGRGECALFEGLSADDPALYKEKLKWTCQNIDHNFEELYEELRPFPSIQIGLEQALLNVKYKESDLYFPNEFYRGQKGIPINGLIWMGTIEDMHSQFENKVNEGYTCIKFKIGTFWQEEQILLTQIRKKFSSDQLEIRVDANGAFSESNVEKVLDKLAELEVHSIEQPIKAGNRSQIKDLCKKSPIPIALDEELIGVFYPEDKKDLLATIEPQYIVLKPSLIGGFKGTEEWINAAEYYGVKWWITSALESNIGLNAIAQFTSNLRTTMPQGLGTGSLYTNNFPSPLEIKNCEIWRK